MPNETYYVFDDRNCKFEGMTKEQIINAIAQATGVTPQDVDEGFISTLVETNRSRSIHIWKGTQAEYNALESHDPDTWYIIDDDTTIEEIQAEYQNLMGRIDILRWDVNHLMDDSGWIPWFAYNTKSENERIGYYKTIGNMVYFQLKIKYDSFPYDYNVGGLGFDLPMLIDIAFSPMEILARWDYSSYLPKAKIIEEGVGASKNQKLVIQKGTTKSYSDKEVLLSFSWPKSADQPNG